MARPGESERDRRLREKQREIEERLTGQTAARENGYQVDPETGLVIDPATGRLTPEGQFGKDHIVSQDPDSAVFVANPESPDTLATQEAYQASQRNMRLAGKSLEERKGMSLDDYTIKPSFYNAMGWDPSERYQNEDVTDYSRTDDEGLRIQREALGGFRQIFDEGGLNDVDRAAIMQSQLQREQELRANRDAITRNAAEQGRGGSLMSFMQQNQAAQGSANMRALDDSRMRAAALGRRDAAMSGMANIGGNIQTAQDAIDKLNADASATVHKRNVERQNAGVDTRYEDERSTARDNVDITNRAEVMNKGEAFGVRGKQRAVEDARGGVMNANTNHGNLMTGKQATLDAKSQQDTANWLTGASLITGAGGEIVKKGFGK